VWRTEATRLDALSEAVGVAVAEVQRRISDTEIQLRAARAAIQDGAAALRDLSRDAGTAGAEARTAAAAARERRSRLSSRVTGVLDQLHQPGIADTAFSAPPAAMFTDLAPDAIAAQSAT
jgi:hypothetical protein